MFSVALLLLFTAGSWVQCQQLTQPPSVNLQPGQRLTITCQVSYSVSSWWTGWIRQPAAGTLEWIGENAGSSSNYKESLKSKFRISSDSSNNRVTLTGENMQPGDSAVYYCARDPQQHKTPADLNKNPQTTRGGVTDQQPLSNISTLIHQKLVHNNNNPRVRSSMRVWSEIRLDQSSSEVKRPGDTVKLSCVTSGFDMTSYYMNWIRQKPGEGLEWIGWMDAGRNSAEYASTFEGRFIMTENVPSSTQYLQLNRLTAEDSAVYFCARRHSV
ncbi:uncharacterized protein LOC128751371 [Synchiropus splendidus]|uniref:uncharacterized protein LOC128751371 n=1 Tax=Synchiropus splendidus TaxID=270530 RepID=UPI00237E6C3C|nr:uncharacterized protein LOC128751371 [Synchiropus splendidus]